MSEDDDVMESEEWEDVPGERSEDEAYLIPFDKEDIDAMVNEWFKHRAAHRAPAKRKRDPGV